MKYLGNMLQLDKSMKIEMSQKRGLFIGEIISLFQEFNFVEPDVFVNIMNIYSASFYESAIWDIFSHDCDGLYKSWNVTIMQAYNVT